MTRHRRLLTALLTAALVQAQDLQDGGTIRGLVLDPAGQPVPGATMYAGVYTVWRATPADTQGRFEVWIGTGYPSGTEVPLIVSAAGFVRAEAKASIGANDLRVVLSRGTRVRGTFTAPPGGTLPEPLVVSVHVGSQVQTVTALDGAFDATGLPPGERQPLVVRVDDFVPHVRADVDLDEHTALDLGMLALDPGATLEVHASDAFGAPVANAYVEVRAVHPSHLSWGAHTDARGIAQVRGLLPATPLTVGTAPPTSFGRAVDVERVEQKLTLDAPRTRVDVVLQRPALLRGTLEWAGGGHAPWLAEERLEVVAAATSPVDHWQYSGAVPGRGVPLGELAAVAFSVWARPGTWDLVLSVRPPSRAATYVARLGAVEIPVPARGELSGELDLGVVRVTRE